MMQLSLPASPQSESAIPPQEMECTDGNNLHGSGLTAVKSSGDDETNNASNLGALPKSTSDPSHSNDLRRLEQRIDDLERLLKNIGTQPAVSHDALPRHTDDKSASHGGYETEGDEEADNSSSVPSGNTANTSRQPQHVIPRVSKLGRAWFQDYLTADETCAVDVMVIDELDDDTDVKLISHAKTPPNGPDTYIDRIRINSRAIRELLHRGNQALSGLIHYHDRVKETIEKLQINTTPQPNIDTDKESPVLGSHRALEEIRCYWQFMDQDILPIYHRLGGPDRHMKVRFADLPYLFQLDDDLYLPKGAQALSTDSRDGCSMWRLHPEYTWSFFIRKFADSARRNEEVFVLPCYCIDFDGRSYVPVVREMEITQFDGERDIKSLPIYPVRYLPDANQTLKSFQKRGQQYQKYVSERQLSYQGWALQHRDEMAPAERVYISSNVIIDHQEAFRTIPDWQPHSDSGLTPRPKGFEQTIQVATEIRGVSTQTRPEWVARGDYMSIEMLDTYDHKHKLVLNTAAEQQKELENEDLILLPRRLFAYALQDRKFVILDLDNLKLPEESGDPFNDLVIRPSQKDMILSLVHSHFRKKEMEQQHGFYGVSQDIINNKGRGLVILLHGVPGVGKSSTAEAVAQKWRKPLFAITCGDLGLAAADVERSLKEIFRLAQLWDCVLLLDEADVFLSERRTSDLQRNALVSVFLRVLEYYSGILFLTTNRVGDVDEAFKSRIHISLYYPPLGEEQTRRIWEMNIKRLRAVEEEHSQVTGDPMPVIDAGGILRYAVDHFKRSEGSNRWNGRQIRNAFLTAAALARYEWHEKASNPATDSSPPIFEIAERHFDTVAKAGAGFEHYLQETKGKSDAELAYDKSLRADYLTKSNQIQRAQKQPPDNSHRGYSHTELYHAAYHDPNRSQAMVNSPGYHQGPVPGSLGMDAYHGHAGHPNYPSDAYLQGQIPQHRFGSSGSNDEFVLAPNSGMSSSHLTPSRSRTPQPPYSGLGLMQGNNVGFPRQSPNELIDDFD